MLPNASWTVTTGCIAKAVPAVAVGLGCCMKLSVAAGPGVLASAKLTVPVPLADHARRRPQWWMRSARRRREAGPEVVAVTVAAGPGNVPLAPDPGAVKVTVVPATRLPKASLTRRPAGSRTRCRRRPTGRSLHSGGDRRSPPAVIVKSALAVAVRDPAVAARVTRGSRDPAA